VRRSINARITELDDDGVYYSLNILLSQRPSKGLNQGIIGHVTRESACLIVEFKIDKHWTLAHYY